MKTQIDTKQSERRASADLTITTEQRKEIGDSLRLLLADVFTLYLKTKNFHWHMSGSHFRDYHLLLDEQGDQLLAMSDSVAERARKFEGRNAKRSDHSVSGTYRIPFPTARGAKSFRERNANSVARTAAGYGTGSSKGGEQARTITVYRLKAVRITLDRLAYPNGDAIRTARTSLKQSSIWHDQLENIAEPLTD